MKASVYCKEDKISLCWDCDNENHSKANKLASKHNRVPINEVP